MAECSPVEIRTRLIGYEDATLPLRFEAGQHVRQVTIRLRRAPVALDELRVEVPASERLLEAGFYARKAWAESTGRDYGQFYDADEVRGRSRRFNDVSSAALSAGVSRMYKRAILCRGLSFYLDGELLTRRYNLLTWLDSAVPLSEVEGIEIYRAVHRAIPDEYREANSNVCGAVLIWTKRRGAEPPRIEAELCEPSSGNGWLIQGVVIDAREGVRLPAAYVTLTVRGRDGGVEDLFTVADREGRFRYCDLQAVPVTIRAWYGDASSEPRPLGTDASPPGDLEIAVPVAGH